MAVLTNKSIASTYKSVLSIGATTESALTTSIQQLTDGLGNSSPLSMSTTQIQFNNDANTFSFPADRGTSGQILKLADANGTLSWADDDLSNTLDFSGGTGTGSVTLDSQVLAFTGTANQIETSASSQAITLSFPTAGVTLPDGSVATTQSPSNNSTKVATTAYVEAAVAAGGGGDVTKIDPITANQIAVWNDSTDELRSDETVTIGTDHSITLYQPNTNSITTNYIIGGGSSMTTGQQNTGFGSSVLTLNTTGVGNVAIGSDSLTTNVSGNNNVAIGLETLKRTTASDNIAIGSRVLQFDTTGYKNTAIGGLSQSNITTAYGNTSLGYNSLIYNSTGIQNTAIGLNSLKGLSTYSASNNTAIGYNSGSAITTGSNNVIIGSNTGSTIATSSSNIIISDGSGTIRQSFDFTGAATFKGRIYVDDTDGLRVGATASAATGTFVNYVYDGVYCTGTTLQLRANGANAISMRTNGLERLNISSGGNVTIGTAAAQDFYLALRGGVGGFFGWDDSANKTIVQAPNTRSLSFQVNSDTFGNGTEAMSISSGGDVTFTGTAPNSGDEITQLNFYNTSSSLNLARITAIRQAGGSNYGALLFSTTNAGTISEKMRISSGGDVAIGSSASKGFLNSNGTAFELDVNRNPNTGVFGDTNKSHARIEMNGASGGSSILFKTASVNNTTATTKLTISSGGNVGIGTTTFESSWTGYTVLKIGADNSIYGNTATNAGSGFFISQNLYQDASNHKYVGAGSNEGGVIDLRNGTFTYSNAPLGTAGNVASIVPRFTISSNGTTFFQAAASTWTTIKENTTAGAAGLLIRLTGGNQGYYYGAYTGAAYEFFVNGAGVVNSTSQTITLISSDIRLKTDVRDYDKGLSEVLAMKPRIYKRKDKLEVDEVGFIAQEMEEALEGSMIDSPTVNEETGEKYKTFKLEWFPLLVKSIQEQQTIIEDLKSRIETLEG